METHEVVSRNADRYVEWLNQACSFPSLAGEPQGLEDMASWLEARFEALGATTERLTFEGAPDALLATIGHAAVTEDEAAGKSVLVYDHYDVQPVDPIELWDNKPFEPVIRDGVFFARGAADNKGDLVARLAGLEVYAELHGELPFGVKFFVEGEEETGSPSFEGIASRYGHKLAADGCIWEGFGVDNAGRPQLVFGAKGLAYVELVHKGLASDQHSSYASIAPSPVWHLVEALATLRSPDGTVLIDGFYDDVQAPGADEDALLAAIPFEEEAEKKRFGIDHFIGEDTGVDLVRRHLFGPTANIAGIHAGFTVPGASKTVLPREAMAKIDFRLVPDQDPDDIVVKLRRHLTKHGYDAIEVSTHSMEHPSRSPVDSVIGRASIAAAKRVWDEGPVIAPLMAGTGPMHPIANMLGIPIVSPVGVYRPESNIHAPNENVLVDQYLKIIEYTVAWLEAFGEQTAGA